MSAFDSAATGIQPPPTDPVAPEADAPPAHPAAGEVTSWLLEGRFFTVDPAGAITAWSPSAERTFGWPRKDAAGERFVEKLIADPADADRVASLLSSGGSGFTDEIGVLDAEGTALRATFALVPIHLGVGYEFNALLQEIASRSRNGGSLSEVKKRHESVLSLIEDALSGKSAQAGDTEEGSRLAGSLLVFKTGGSASPVAPSPAAPAAATPEASSEPPPVADNVVSITDATWAEEARAQLERARREAEEGRVEVRNLEGQLEEARREAQRARNEVDVSRQAASDARDSLTVTQREAEEARRQLEDSRRAVDEVRAAAEGARIRSEEAQREADSLRAQLREARESARGLAGRADDDLARAQEATATAERELAEARAEAGRLEAEVAPLRERYQAAQRELGALRADLESARAAAAERDAISERRAAELMNVKAERDQATGELAALRAELEQAQATAAEAQAAAAEGAGSPNGAVSDAELEALRERLERMGTAFARAPVANALIAPDGRYIEVNDALCSALGQSRDRLLSAEPPAIVHADDSDAYLDLVRRLLAGEQAGARGYRRYVHGDGHAITMRESVSLVRDAEGRPSMFVVQLEEAELDERVVVDADVAAEEPPGTEMVTTDSGALSGDSMRRALEDDMFQLHCQPVLDLRTNAVSQYELLIRMVGDDGRIILPQAFLGPARRAGLAHAIDRWVVRKAIALLHERQLAGEDISLEVNLSPEAVHDAELPAMIDEELAVTPIDPGRLVLEVTGATAAEHIDATRELARRLRGLGCRFALDDFRSNFGSFRLLKDLPLDYLKLDGELVGSLAESRTSQLIVKALVDVAAGTGMKTVAVFVSDDQTLAMLRQQGVDYAQGYKVGRPRAVSEVWPGTEAVAAAGPGDTPRLPPG